MSEPLLVGGQSNTSNLTLQLGGGPPRVIREDVPRERGEQADRVAYGACGVIVIGATFRELDYKTLIFFERAVPIR